MSAAAVMAIVLFVFFLAGIGVGIIAVYAVSVRRAGKADGQDHSPEAPRDEWPYLNEAGPDDEPDEPPWWQARTGN